MVLTPHAVVGAAVTSFFRLNPFTAFWAGFLSHFFLDSFPHWDYELKSAELDETNPLKNDMIINRDFYFDLVKIGFDCLLGFILSVLFFVIGGGFSFWTIFFGALGGVAPDFLQFVYMKFRREPFLSLQKAHNIFHTSKKITNPVLGVVISCSVLLFGLLLGNIAFFIF